MIQAWGKSPKKIRRSAAQRTISRDRVRAGGPPKEEVGMDTLGSWMLAIAIGIYCGGTLVFQWGMRRELSKMFKELQKKNG
jgi:hypothetical protein